MQCSQCGYLFQPFETECPRCRRMGRSGLPTPPAVMQPPPPYMPSAPITPASTPPPQTALARSRAHTVRLSWMVAVLSTACIFLSGLVLGRFWLDDKTVPNGYSISPRPLAVAPAPPVTPPPPPQPTTSNTENIETFIAFVGKLEATKHVFLQVRRQQERTRSGTIIAGSFSLPDRYRREGAASPQQLKLEWDRWLQLRQDLNNIPCPTPCFLLYGAYQKYLYTVEQTYSELDRLTGAERENQPDPETALTNLYNTEPGLIQQAAQEADRELRNVCLRHSLTKSFTIE